MRNVWEPFPYYFHTESLVFHGCFFPFNRFKAFKNSNLKKNYFSIESSHLFHTQLPPLSYNAVWNTLLRLFFLFSADCPFLFWYFTLCWRALSLCFPAGWGSISDTSCFYYLDRYWWCIGVLVKYSVKLPLTGICQTLPLWLDEVMGLLEEEHRGKCLFRPITAQGACWQGLSLLGLTFAAWWRQCVFSTGCPHSHAMLFRGRPTFATHTQERRLGWRYGLQSQHPDTQTGGWREAGGSFKVIKDSRPACDYGVTVSKNNPERSWEWSSEVEKRGWK